MQAIILAAGMGRRLGELTKNNTKCMVEVNGTKLIDRTLLFLSHLNLNRIIIVVGYESQNLIDHINEKYKDSLNIIYVHNTIFDKTNNIYSLALAKDYFKEDDTILLESDLIFEEKMLQHLVNAPYQDIALVAKYEPWMDGTMVCIDDDNNIINFVPKKAFRHEDKDLYYKTVNIYKLSQDFINGQYLPLLEAYCKMKGNNEYYEEVLRIVTMIDKSKLKALPIGDIKWYEIDDTQDLDIAETIFADSDLKLKKTMQRFGGYWRFPQMLDFCYLVNPFFPPQKMKEEIKANFDSLLSGYPSGMYVNSLLAGKNYNVRQDFICVGNGAAELIRSVMNIYRDMKVGVTFPTFEEYPHRLPESNIVAFVPQDRQFQYSAADLITFFSDKDISLLVVINPDNPSGNLIPKNDIISLLDWARPRNIDIILDESFIDFSDDCRNNSFIHNELLSNHPNLIVLKSLSKSYGVPGLRLGVVASANMELIQKIKKDVSIWNINSFAEYFMQIYSKYDNDYSIACKEFVAEREIFYKELKEIDFLDVIKSQANYFLCEVKSRYSASGLTRTLLERHNILIKDCSTKSAFNGRDYIRIAIRDRADNHTLYEILKTL